MKDKLKIFLIVVSGIVIIRLLDYAIIAYGTHKENKKYEEFLDYYDDNVAQNPIFKHSDFVQSTWYKENKMYLIEKREHHEGDYIEYKFSWADETNLEILFDRSSFSFHPTIKDYLIRLHGEEEWFGNSYGITVNNDVLYSNPQHIRAFHEAIGGDMSMDEQYPLEQRYKAPLNREPTNLYGSSCSVNNIHKDSGKQIYAKVSITSFICSVFDDRRLGIELSD